MGYNVEALRVIRNRGPLTIHQALCMWLVEDPEGPEMTHHRAKEMLGLSTRQEVQTHLARARVRLAGCVGLPWREVR